MKAMGVVALMLPVEAEGGGRGAEGMQAGEAGRG